MLNHLDPCRLGVSLVAFIFTFENMDTRCESLRPRDIAVVVDEMPQRLTRARRRVRKWKCVAVQRDQRCGPRVPGMKKVPMKTVLLAGPRIAELFQMRG